MGRRAALVRRLERFTGGRLVEYFAPWALCVARHQCAMGARIGGHW